MDVEQHEHMQQEGRKTSYYVNQKSQKSGLTGSSTRRQALIGLGSLVIFFGVLYFIFF